MKKILFSVLLLLVMSTGCAHIGGPLKKLTIDEIAGAWEHVHFGYIYFYINETGEKYLIPGYDEKEDILKIDSISFADASAIITLVNVNINIIPRQNQRSNFQP